jgi:hypothetical protein
MPDGAAYLEGAAYGLAAVSIWSGWSVMTRLTVTTSLDAWDIAAWDIAALRFGVAGVLLLPVLVWRGPALDRLGCPGLAAIIAGLGPPYVLVAAGGLAICARVRPGSAQSGVQAAVRRTDRYDRSGREAIDRADAGAFPDTCRCPDHGLLGYRHLERFAQLRRRTLPLGDYVVDKYADRTSRRETMVRQSRE